jgi:uncharacterized membrane protein YheB (UPF0754 family)
MYLNDTDLKSLRSVEDQEMNELFQEALSYDKTLMISSINVRKKKWFSKKYNNEIYYNIYHEILNDNGKSMYEAREMLCASGNKAITMAYLYGIINGNLHNK